jgi:carboxyl-terminal processing protease
MKKIFGSFLGCLLVVSLLLPSLLIAKTQQAPPIDSRRNQLIGYMLAKQLPVMHFSDKVMNKELSLAAFDLYLKQLDFQKRFLLQGDVDTLTAYGPDIAPNLLESSIVLPEVGYGILITRIDAVKKITEQLLAAGFDYNREEQFETDPEKLHYAVDKAELRSRWRKILKAQIISRYLDLVQEQKDAAEEKGEAKSADAPKSDKELWAEAEKKVAKRNANFFNRLHQETLQDHYDRFFNAVARAFGPHTNYMAPAGKEYFDILMRGSLEGIGALLREEDGYIKVVSIIPGSASARQGRLQAEDIILDVAQGDKEPVEITDMRLREAVRLIRGPKGSEVRLTVKKPDGTKVLIPIQRDVVQIEETFVKSMLIKSPGGSKVGYVMIPSFYRDFEKTRSGSDDARNSTGDTRKAIEELKKQGISGLILDLRNNGGGALLDSIYITGLFIPEGPVVLVKDSYGEKRILSDEDPSVTWDGPLLVLVNKFSASASEILAAALQDYGRAVIVGGARTYGKGVVQTIRNMNDNLPLLRIKNYDDLGAVKVTIQKFYRVNGGSTQYKGVVPDIVLPSLFQHLKSGEQYLDYSLPWDQVTPVPFHKSEVSYDMALLKQRSQARVLKDEELQVIAEEAAKATARAELTSISLTLADMRAKREEAETAREKIGAHYLKYREEQDTENGTPPAEDSDYKGDKDKWKKEIQEDPYINESLLILDDMRTLMHP